MSSDQNVNRRTLLAGSAATLVSTLVPHRAIANDRSDLPWIDAHSHIWTPDVSRFTLQPGITVDDLAPQRFTDDDLMAVAQPEGVGRVVLIQHNIFHGTDNSYLTDAWRRNPERFRVVAMIDDLRPKCDLAMKQLLKRGVTGFRIKPRHGISDWLNTDGMQQMWKTAAETRQSMCCLINSSDLPQVNAACARNPNTPVVIDHFARVGVDGTIRDADVDQLCALAKHKNVRIKISAYYALGQKHPPHDDLIPMIKRLYEAMGSDRLMWASDCPYQLDGVNTYAASIALIRDVIDFVSDDERKNLLAGTAEKTFFFDA